MTDGERLVQGLTDDQHQQLLKPVNDARVNRKQRNSYLEGWDVIAHLTRIFGFGGWDDDVTSEALIFEEDREAETGGKTRTGWWVAYRVALRLTIRSVDGSIITIKTGANTGQADNQPDRAKAHDLAYKAAHTNALKRAAAKLGDQFGLSLYDDGKLGTVVGRTLVWSEPGQQQNPADVEQIAADAVADSDQDHPEPGVEPQADVEDIGLHLATTRPANDPPRATAKPTPKPQPTAPASPAAVSKGPEGETPQAAEKRLDIKGKAIKLLRGTNDQPGPYPGLLSLDALGPDEWPDAISYLEVEAAKIHAAKKKTG